MERRRFELSAVEVFEVGKAWAEADGDIREAMDFCLFYAQQMRLHRSSAPDPARPRRGKLSALLAARRRARHRAVEFPGRDSLRNGLRRARHRQHRHHETGRAIRRSSARCLMEIFEEAGVPPGVLNFLHGDGLGHRRVSGRSSRCRHDRLHRLARSRVCEFGKSAGKTRPGQRELKRVVCEMGGKNAIIVDSDADLDETIVDTIYSAFGYQGQKCSACSRLIVLEENYDRVMRALARRRCQFARWQSRRAGDHRRPRDRRDRLPAGSWKLSRAGKSEATLAFQATECAGERLFRSANHFHRCETGNDRLASEEIFGPVLSVIKVRDLDEAISSR